MNLFTEQEAEEKERKLNEQRQAFISKFPQNNDIHFRINFKANGISGIYYYKMVKTKFHNYGLNTQKVMETYHKLTTREIPVCNNLLISTMTVREYHPFTYNQLLEKYEVMTIHHNLGWYNNIYKQDKLF